MFPKVSSLFLVDMASVNFPGQKLWVASGRWFCIIHKMLSFTGPWGDRQMSQCGGGWRTCSRKASVTSIFCTSHKLTGPDHPPLSPNVGKDKTHPLFAYSKGCHELSSSSEVVDLEILWRRVFKSKTKGL